MGCCSVLSGGSVDHALRLKLVDALQNRRWAHLDAERVATGVADGYQSGTGLWQVWRSQVGHDPPQYHVARKEHGGSVYEGFLVGRARDVADALNDIEAGAQ